MILIFLPTDLPGGRTIHPDSFHPHGYGDLWFKSWVHCLALLSLVHWHCIYFLLHLPDRVHHLYSSDSRVISEDQILADKCYVRNLTQIQLCCYLYPRHHLINMKLHFSPLMEHCVTLCRMSSVAWPLPPNNEHVSCFSWLWLYKVLHLNWIFLLCAMGLI